MSKHFWTDEEISYLATAARNLPNREAAARMSDHFGIEFTFEQLRCARKRYKIPNGLSGKNLADIRGYYPPKTEDARRRQVKGQFKTGSKPHNTLPIGTVRPDCEGYIEKKIADHPKARHLDNWKRLSTIVWEKHHGPIPKGCDIVYLDQNKRHCSIENLALVERKLKPYLGQGDLYHQDPKLTQAGITLAKMVIKTRELKKEENESENYDQ